MSNLSFLEHYQTIIETPSISAFDENIDQTNRPLIDILSGWFSDLGIFHNYSTSARHSKQV